MQKPIKITEGGYLECGDTVNNENRTTEEIEKKRTEKIDHIAQQLLEKIFIFS